VNAFVVPAATEANGGLTDTEVRELVGVTVTVITVEIP
jgi:hypothetical protein